MPCVNVFIWPRVWIECYLQRLCFPNMKPFAISESHLTLSEVQWENKVKEDYKTEKKVADHHWQRTDSISTLLQARVYDCVTFRNCMLFLCFSTREKEWQCRKKICLKCIRSVQRLLFEGDKVTYNTNKRTVTRSLVGEKVENSRKCVFVLISMLGAGRVRIPTILQLH